MTQKSILCAAALLLAAAVSVTSGDYSSESLKTSHDQALSVDGAIPLALSGKAAALRCSTRMKWRSSGHLIRCPYGRVVTGVQMIGDIAQLTCAEVEVTCR